jgi:hypothetical protein
MRNEQLIISLLLCSCVSFFSKNNYLIASRTFEQTADFFRGDNKEGVEARNEVSELPLLLVIFFSLCIT